MWPKSIMTWKYDGSIPTAGRSVVLSRSVSAPLSSVLCVSRSSRRSTSPTRSRNAQRSTSRIANMSGGVRATTRCGPPLREPARMFHMTSARRWPRPTPGRLPTRSAMMFPSRNVHLSRNKSVWLSRMRSAEASPWKSAKMFLSKCVVSSTESSQSESAGRRPRRFAMFPVNCQLWPQHHHQGWHQCCQVPHLWCQPSQPLPRCQTHQLSTSSQTWPANHLTSSVDWPLDQSTNSLASNLDKEASPHWMRFLQQGKQRLQRMGRDLNSVRSWSSLLSRRPFHQFLVQRGGGGGGLAHMKDNCAVFRLFRFKYKLSIQCGKDSHVIPWTILIVWYKMGWCWIDSHKDSHSRMHF